MTSIKILFATALAAAAMNASADDSIIRKMAKLDGARMRFEQRTLANPALMNLLSAPSLSEITVSGVSTPASADKIPQLGSGGRCFYAEASSFQRLGKAGVVWGNASYENGRRYDVAWNETSDFLLLYPYVMADAKGGDTKYEEYRLDGGYSTSHGKAHYGIEAGYRALSEYRDRDPRPNNTVADLFARLGFGYAMAKNYVLAVDANAGKYKQTNELAFYNELGAQMEYHLTGVGNDFARFSGLSNNCFYKGHELGATLSLANTEAYGWSASLGYTYTQKEKILTDLNRLPLNKLKVNALKGSVGYGTKRYGLTVSAKYSERQGFDNLFGDASGSVYPQIGSRKQYKGTITKVEADGFWTICETGRLTLDVEPLASYCSAKSTHYSSGNNIDTDNLLLGIKGCIKYTKGGNLWSARAGVTRRQNLHTDINLYDCADEQLATTLQGIANYLDGGETSCSIGAGYTRKIWGNKAITAALCWKHSAYNDGSGNTYETKISFCL